MNDLKHLRQKQIQLKLRSLQKALGCTVIHEEETGIWVTGAPIAQYAVQTGAIATSSKLALFVPFESIDWFAMPEE